MLTFIKKKDRLPIGFITGGSLNNKIIYSDMDEKSKKRFVFDELLNDKLNKEITVEDGTLFPIPYLNADGEKQRQSIFICGQSGSGKSTWIARYVEYYKMLFPKNDVILFSKKEKDEALDHIKAIKRIPITPELMEEDIEPEDLKDSLVIFDDVDTIKDKKLQEFIHKLRDDLLETGRSENVYVLITGHTFMNWNKTKVTLSESSGVVVYPKRTSSETLKNFLRKYCGLDKDQIAKIEKLDSRAVYINKNYPKYVVSDHKIYLL